ncbi:MAG: HIRAN domain-containing protein [Immundisolibacter sp.]|uniref:HIRAN domain-containing protein n=1 Tax=Immundisolibacter sp. TaxID=1934948 RepID=UPI003D141611
MALSLHPTRWLAHWPRWRANAPPLPPLELPLAGLRHHRAAAIWPFLKPGLELRLRREAWNHHDPQAVAVYYRQEKLGYLPRTDNATIARWLDQGRALRASIAALGADAERGGRVLLRVQLLQRTHPVT